MELWQLLLLFLAGVASGWINTIAGGGSILAVPVMVFLGMPGPVANGTNRIGIIAQNITAVWGFFRKGFSDFRLSATLAICASIGAFFGANAGVQLDGVWFERTLALIMIGVLIIMAAGGRRRRPAPGVEPEQKQARNLALGHLLFVAVGFWGGFIQVGVGFLMMPVLYQIMGLDLVRTNMHKAFITLVFSVVALAVFAAQVEIEWTLGIALAAGYAVGGWFGASAAISRGEAFIRWVFYAALVAMAVKLLFF